VKIVILTGYGTRGDVQPYLALAPGLFLRIFHSCQMIFILLFCKNVQKKQRFPGWYLSNVMNDAYRVGTPSPL
jgi:hypothetical protein